MTAILKYDQSNRLAISVGQELNSTLIAMMTAKILAQSCENGRRSPPAP